MDNVTISSLERKFKGEGAKRFAEIARLGGFGLVAPHALDGDYPGGLDIKGVLADDNTATSEADKNKIRELVGMSNDAKPVKEGAK